MIGSLLGVVFALFLLAAIVRLLGRGRRARRSLGLLGITEFRSPYRAPGRRHSRGF